MDRKVCSIESRSTGCLRRRRPPRAQRTNFQRENFKPPSGLQRQSSIGFCGQYTSDGCPDGVKMVDVVAAHKARRFILRTLDNLTTKDDGRETKSLISRIFAELPTSLWSCDNDQACPDNNHRQQQQQQQQQQHHRRGAYTCCLSLLAAVVVFFSRDIIILE
jgi:hypothetical protein